MNKRKCLLLVNILCVLSIPIPIIAADSPDANEVLRRFAEARKNFTSFILETKEEGTFDYPADNTSGKRHQKIECRFDGSRGRIRYKVWGTVGFNEYASEDKARYLSQLWDGENYYNYSRRVAASEPDIVIMARSKDPGGVTKGMKTLVQFSDVPGLMMGYIRGVGIDKILACAEHLKMRQEKFRGVDCYVIDAAVKEYGNYTLWIDPTHDYHIIKSRSRQKEGDFIFSQTRKLPKNSSRDTTFEVLEFQQIEGLWFLKQIKTTDQRIDAGNLGGESKIFDITSIVLNPDHEALRSFIPDDIPNGATVLITALSPSIEYIWQDGKLLDGKGNVIMDCRPKDKKEK